MKALLVIIILAMLAAIVYVIWSKTRTTAAVVTNQNKNELKDGLANFLTHRKYLAVSQSENLMTFAMDKSASCLIAFVLLLIGLIPGILYLVLGGSTKTLTIQFVPLQSQAGDNVRIQGQRSIVNRVKKFVAAGTLVAAQAMPAIQPAGLAPAPVPVCPKCGEGVASGLKFCQRCGTELA